MKICYSVVSRGTEKYSNHGYIGISEVINNKRYILGTDHGIQSSDLVDGFLVADSKYTIENIIFSRFELISSLALSKYKLSKEDNILIYGLGNIGITTLVYLLDKGVKKIDICVKENQLNYKKVSEILSEAYSAEINILYKVNDYKNYNVFIDATGSNDVIQKIIDECNYHSKLIIVSTPRDEFKNFSFAKVCRKNLNIMGAHEFNGIKSVDRQKQYNNLLKQNVNKDYLHLFINFHDYSEKKLSEIYKIKTNFIDSFKY